LWINIGFKANKVLAILDLNKSTYHYRVDHEGSIKLESGGRPIPGYSMNINGYKVPDELIKEWIITLIETEAFAYGYRKLQYAERRYNLIINDKKVYRLCLEMKILRPQRRKKLKHPRVIARNREVTASNQLWMTDLKYGYVQGEDKFFYVVAYLDVYPQITTH
jgi:putative transposase